ncbi:MAG: histidinol-phosphate transaminase [Candidatus Omnitrophota bacterium]
MPEIKKYLKDLHRTNPAEALRKGRMRLDMNEGVHGLPDGFVRSVAGKIDNKLMLTYPACAGLLKKIARHNGIRPENICLGNGSDGVIKYIFDAYISPNDKVLLTNPTFAMYPIYCRISDAKPVVIDYKPDLTFPFEEFIGKLKRGVKMAVVVNPNNPTGDVIDPDRMVYMIRHAAQNDILMVVDEAYFYYYPETVIKLVAKYDNLIILRTFSKLCAMANVRIGYAAAAPSVIRNIKKVKPSFDVNGLAVLFTSELLDRPAIISAMTKKARAGGDYLCRMLKRAGIEHRGGNTNFILIKCGSRAGEIVKKLKSRGILVSGNFSQPFLKDYLRVTIGDKSQMAHFWKTFVSIWRRTK